MSANSMARRVHSALLLLSENGPSALLRALSRKIAIVETYIAFRVDLVNDLPPFAAAAPLEFRRATREDFARFRAMPHPFTRHAQFYDRFGIEECYIALCRGKIAHLAWVYYPDQAKKHPTPFRILRPDETAIANCVTLPEFRGQKIYPAVVRHLLQVLKEQGYGRCYMYIETGNFASQRGVAKIGFKPVGKTWRVRLFFHSDPAAGIYLRGRCS